MVRSVRKYKETIEIRSLPLNRLRSHRYFPIAVLALVIFLAACIHVWQRVVVIGLVTEVSHLQREKRDLADGLHKVQADIAELAMSTRIERYAMDTLGLKRVAADQIHTLASYGRTSLDADELTTVLSSIKRVADYLPVTSEAEASHLGLEPIRLETDPHEGDLK